MNFWKNILGRNNHSTVKFLRDEIRQHPSAPHIKIAKKIYSANNKESALIFLQKQKVTEPFYYIELDTPSGRYGIDNGGRIYDSKGQFIELEPESTKIDYDEETVKIKTLLEIAMKEQQLQIPKGLFLRSKSTLQSLRVIIEDSSADFYLRRMAIWWGSQFRDESFNTFLKERFVKGKDRKSLFQKAESSQSDVARAEEGLHIAALDVLSGDWKP